MKEYMREHKVGIIIIGAISVLLIIVLGLYLLSDTLDYDDAAFNQVEDWNTFNEEMKNNNGLMLVYVYSPVCDACNRIKQEVLSFASVSDSYDIPVYLANADALINTGHPPVRVPSVPAMLVIEDDMVIDRVSNVTNVRVLMDLIESDNYTP